MDWTEDEIPELKGKTAIITGANSGLGFETAKQLAKNGAKVVMACISEEEGDKAREEIINLGVEEAPVVMEIDLASTGSIEEFAEKFRSKFDRLDILVNNAGVMMIPWRQTEFGFEYQFGVNFLGHFKLNSELFEVLEKTQNSRVISVTSLFHKRAEMNFEVLNSKEEYDRVRAYADSKMALMIYTLELDEMFKIAGIDSKAVAAHPGYAATDLHKKAGDSFGGELGERMAGFMNRFVAQPPEKGALPILYAATDETLEGGEMVGPGGFKAIRGSPEVQQPDTRALDKQMREKLWSFSEKVMGIDFHT